jgi:hypothetical protein
MGARKTKRSSGPTGSTNTGRMKAESPGLIGQNVSSAALQTVKARQARQAKREITKGAIEKSNAENTMTDIALVKQDRSALTIESNKPDPSNGRVHGRKLIRWSRKYTLVYFCSIS